MNQGHEWVEGPIFSEPTNISKFANKDVVVKKVTRLKLNKENRMIRFGFGKHNNQWFVRLDLWWFGIRVIN